MSDEKEKKVVSKSFSRSLEGSRDFTGTLTYQQKGSYDEILADSPDLGVHSKHFPSDCVLQTVDANSSDGNLWTVVCKFFKRAVETSKFKHGGPSERNVKIKTTENQVSILNHPRYRNKIPGGLRGVLEKLSKSNINEQICFPKSTNENPEMPGAYDYLPDTDRKDKIAIGDFFRNYICNGGWQRSFFYDVNIEIVEELYRVIAEKGIKTFPISCYEVIETELVSEYNFSKELGKISKPNWSKIPKLPNNGNWRLAKEDVSWKEALQKWERVRTFESHKEGEKWDELIFKV